MPTLHPDILKEIIPYLCVPDNQYITLKSLKTFMQSGKEPFEAVLKYFSHVNSVAVHEDHLTIFVERINSKNDDEIDMDIFEIPYDFQYFEDILKIIRKSNKVLIIEDYPSVPKGKRALAMLTQKDLKSITFSNYNILPSDYYKFFKNECNFKEAFLILNGATQTTLDQFFTTVPLFHYTICTYMNASLIWPFSDTDFWGTPASISEEFIDGSFRDVKSLSLQQCYYFLTDSITYPEEVYHYFGCLSKCFPNLENLNVDFDTTLFIGDKWNDLAWLEVYKNMTKFSPNGFSNISTKIKGSIRLRVFEVLECLDTALKIINKKANVEVENDKKQLIKKLEIHDGLNFEFILEFNQNESNQNL